MPGRVVKATEVRGITHLIVEAAGDTWQVSIKPLQDMNNAVSGYRTWVCRQSERHETLEDATQSGLAFVEIFAGVEIEERG